MSRLPFRKTPKIVAMESAKEMATWLNDFPTKGGASNTLSPRTIVSGIAESFSPEEVVGKQVTVLVNLAPRKLRGVESQGMILMTENENGDLVFVNPDSQIQNGLKIS